MRMFLLRVVRGDATTGEARDTGMAAVLILLLLAWFFERSMYVTGALGVHLVNMTAPLVFRPAAVLWFGLSHLIGAIVSRLILILVFLIMVTPVGMIRRWLGADSLQLRTFRAGRSSVMKVRNHTFTGRDPEKPY